MAEPPFPLADILAKLDGIATTVARAQLGDDNYALDGTPLGDAVLAALDTIRHQLLAADLPGTTDDQRSR